MSEFEDDNEAYLPREAPAEDYKIAVERLKRFGEEDLSGVTNLEQMAEKAGTVGQDLGRIVATHGTPEVLPAGNLGYVLRQNVGDSRVIVTVDSDHVVVRKFDKYHDIDTGNSNKIETIVAPKGDDRGGFRFTLPVDAAIDPTDKSFSKTLGTYLMDFRKGGKTFILKESTPQNVNNFTTLLQEAVKDLAPTFRPPTELNIS